MSLILKKDKVYTLLPVRRYILPPIKKILKRLANVTIVSTNRKGCVFSRVHACVPDCTLHTHTSQSHDRQSERTSFFISFFKLPLKWSHAASLTVEAALELPVFFVLIAIVLQYACVMRTAAQFSGHLTETAQEMAIAAYKQEYGDANNIIRGALSDAWATTQVINKAEDKDAVRLASFLNSSYMKDGDRIRLVLSYQPKPKYALITLPFTFFVQKAVVRGWVGKDGYSGRQKDDNAEENKTPQTVLVTEHGSVYHTDPDCCHLKVTVIPISESQLSHARNTNGEKYHKCPYCGNDGDEGNHQRYIDPYGNCWHTSLDCPSLMRTVHEVDLDECGHMHECKDCRKARGG